MFALLMVLGLVPTLADDFEMARSTIDGGGVVRSTGGDFELSGTIGQPDAGTLTGEGFELNGGFWFPLATGDCNTDGGVNLHDFATFKTCLSGPDHPPVGQACPCFDADSDNDVDLSDMRVFQAGFGG
jgi:hypothetical protein